MIIETWVFLIILAVFTVIGLISLIGWAIADNRLEEANQLNRELTEKNGELLRYTYKIQFKKELQEITNWGEQK